MPCYDERDSPTYMQAEFDSEKRRLIARNDKLARMLCFACGIMDDKGLLKDDRTKSIKRMEMMNLIAWWKDHQEFDNKRKRKKK